MSIQRTLAQLKLECSKRGIQTPTLNNKGKTLSRKDYVDLLASKSLEEMKNPTWGLKRRVSYESPMLCFSFKNLKPAEQTHAMVSDEWVAEEKLDGARMWVCYHPEEGFTFFSRNVSVEDYLPVDYTDKILIHNEGTFKKPSEFVGVWKASFILDCEVICESGNIDTSLFSKSAGTETGVALNACTAILSIHAEASHKIQTTQAPLKLCPFDVVEINEQPVWRKPLRERRPLLEKIVSSLQKVWDLRLPKWYGGDTKESYYMELIKEGKEGMILKNLNSPYIPTSSRRRDSQVKRKRSMAESLGGDIDAFITGFVKSEEDKSWGNLIGTFELSVFLLDEFGGEKEHVIASVAGMPMEVRKEATILDENGNPHLNPSFLDRVLVINGQAVSAKSLRFKHATIDWSVGFRKDKTKHDCILLEEFVQKMIL